MKKNEVLALFSLDRKKFEQMDEDEILNTMKKLDQIKIEAVKEGRFLGILTRCRERQKEYTDWKRCPG